MMRRIFALSSALSLAMLAACGGGGSTSSFVPSPSSSPGKSGGADTVSFVIAVPAASGSSATKRPAYVSPNTGSVAIALQSVNGTASTSAATVAAIGASASGCTAAASGYSCTVVVSAPAGDDLFSISTYQSSNGSGTALATTAVAANVGATAASVTLDLGGVPASVSFSPARLPLVDDGNIHRFAVVLNAADASGATIVGAAAYQSPVSLQIENDPAQSLSLSTTSVSQPGTVVTVTYNSAKTLTDASIVASDNGMTPATLVAAPLNVSPTPVTVFDDGTVPVSISEGGFTGSFTATVANTADATSSLVPGTLNSGSAVANITPKVHFDVTTLNVGDGNLTDPVPLQIVPQNSAYKAFGSEHEMLSPYNMVEGPGGIFWAGDSGTGNLVSFNPSTGAYTTVNVDSSFQGPQGVAFDANGNLWYGDGPQIGEYTPSTGNVQTYASGLEPNAFVTAIVPGPSGTMWFYDPATGGELSGNPTYFGSINTSTGAITEYESSKGAGPFLGPMSMVTASDGSIWFADQYNYSVGHINTSNGTITEYKLSEATAPQQSPDWVTIAPNGAIWFAAFGTTSDIGSAGTVNATTGAITYYPLPQSGRILTMATGSNGDLWYIIDPVTDIGSSSQTELGIINPQDGAIYQYPSFFPQFSIALSIVDRGDGTLWILDGSFGQIGDVTFK